MIVNESNNKIYEQLYQQKALTEKIIGLVEHPFYFVKAEYQAVFTEAIDFTMFDKVICGILQIDDVLSFEEIADVLGLNVIHRPEDGRYMDFGEKEILEHAISSLIEFKMIETGDIHHSRCQLTDIGREYASKGMKFLPSSEKEFSIYFDLNDRKHTHAKQRFEKAKYENSFFDNIDFDLEDELFIKGIAKTQIPNSYNPNKLRNFTNMELLSSNYCVTNFPIACVLSTRKKSVRFLAFDEEGEVFQPINKIIESNFEIKNELINSFFSSNNNSRANKSKFQLEYEKKAIEAEEKIAKLIRSKEVETAFEQSKYFYLNNEFIEIPYFELNIKDFFNEQSKEFWMILPEIDSNIFNGIQSIIRSKLKEHNTLIIIATDDIETKYKTFFEEEAKTNYKFFFSTAAEIDSRLLLSKNGNDKWALIEQPFLLEYISGNSIKKVKQETLFKLNNWENGISDIYKDCKESIGTIFTDIITNTVNSKYHNYIEHPKHLTKNNIENFIAHTNKIKIFKRIKSLSDKTSRLLKTFYAKIDSLKHLLFTKIEEDFNQLKSKITNEENQFSISELRDFEDALQKMIDNLYDKESELAISIIEQSESIQLRITKIKTSLNQKKSPNKRKPQKRNNYKKRRNNSPKKR